MSEETPTRILVLFYSFTGHTALLAKYIEEGARELEGVEVQVKQVPELLPDSFFADKPAVREARQSFAEVPVATVDDLLDADGIAFGTPVHFGSFSSQLKQFLDQLSPVFQKGTLVNKPAALFTTAGSIHGGEEVALLSLMIPLLNLGMIPIGVPYPIQGEGLEFDAGSPYGAIYVTGHTGARSLEEGDKKIARILGKRLAGMTKVMKAGIAASEDCAFLGQEMV